MPEEIITTKDTQRKKYVLKKRPVIKTDYKVNYGEDLNEAQLEAIKSKDGPILVIAGAGSGKTKTLTYRVARLIEDGIKPENILLLTFTKKAAAEMLSRATIVLDNRCEKVAGGTFHSFANIILRKYSKLLGLKNNFTIMDRADCEDVINHIVGQLFPKKEKRFPKKSTLLDIYSKSINKVTPTKQIIADEFPQFAHCEDKIIEVHKAYVAYKRENSVLDYDDLLLYIKLLLENNDGLRKRLSNEYKYIMVDEYQDTNTLQADVIRLLASEHNNIMAVGDDAQSIYSFRGANYRNILDFPRLFENTKIIKLEQNYRSTQNILKLTNEIISKAKEKYTKNLFSNIVSPQVPALICAKDTQMEADFICQRILELLDEDISLSDICVLTRNARMSYNLEIELSKRAIPFQKFGGPKFMETAHIKDVVAHLRVILNPDDVISLTRILLLLKGVGASTVNNIMPIIKGDLKPDIKLLPSNKSQSLTPLFKTLGQLRDYSTTKKPEEIVSAIINYYRPILKDKYDDFSKREKDLDHFEYLSTQYSNLEDFISDLALEPPDASVEGMYKKNSDDEALTISTIHSAKGLEWDSVFIIGAVDGRFPSAYSFNSEEEMDEELRLMYVATTRAKNNLYITYPVDMYDYSMNMVLSKPSRFLDGIPDDILERWDITEEE
ncbi:MAG TPA: ATP-dependent helicase [Cyanobacteria bacterium UBA10660]|nr:MAG TPA: ATP-dependent DNA helicase [Candidatus Gastranaerophilales bacterium HUM_1]HAS94400.1 ATP-dependent helicase [Cyanobacteria bacterium UBA10660]